MFKISEFSKFSRVPVKTLRYYDEIGLFSPAEVDRFTNYRYYSAEQLPRLNRILALKEMGLSLAEITRLLNAQVSLEEMRGCFALRKQRYGNKLRTRKDGWRLWQTDLSRLNRRAKCLNKMW